MEKGIPAHQEDLGELLIVISHHRGPGCFLCHRQEIMHVLHGPKGFLPKLELNRGIELRETRVKMVLEGISIREINGVWLVRVFGDI